VLTAHVFCNKIEVIFVFCLFFLCAEYRVVSCHGSGVSQWVSHLSFGRVFIFPTTLKFLAKRRPLILVKDAIFFTIYDPIS